MIVDQARGHEPIRVPIGAGAHVVVSELAVENYMRSASHRRSHDRVPQDPVQARPVRVDRFSLVAT